MMLGRWDVDMVYPDIQTKCWHQYNICK
jgi:hypothetical protein